MDDRKKQPEPKKSEVRPLAAEKLDQVAGGLTSRPTDVKDSHDRYTN